MSNDDEEWVPGNKHELLAVIAHEWGLLMDVVSKLDESQMTISDEGGWSPKDNLAHLGEWMKIMLEHHIDRRPAHEVVGVSEDVTKDWDMEIINPVLFERNKDRSTDEIVAWLKKVYEEAIRRLDAIEFVELLAPRYDEDPEKRPLLLWVIGDTSEHFAEHRAVIEKML